MNRVMSSLLCGFILLVFFTLQSNAQYTLTLELPDTNIWEMVVDRNGILWITDVDTLKSFDGTSWASYPEYEVTKLQSDENGIIWFGGSKEHSDGKFFKYEGAQFVEVMDYPDNIKEPFTFAVHEGNIWLWDADIDRFHLYYLNGVSWIDYTEIAEGNGRCLRIVKVFLWYIAPSRR